MCAVRVRERGRLRHAYAGALMLGLLPWLDPALAFAGLPAAFCLVRWTLREGRRLVALITAELLLGSLVFYARLNETLFGGPLPSAAAADPGPDAAALAERAPNLLGLWLDPSAGLLRWAPVLALGFVGAWLLWRSRREHVASAIPARREAERVAELLVATVGAQWLVAAFTVDGADGRLVPGAADVRRRARAGGAGGVGAAARPRRGRRARRPHARAQRVGARRRVDRPAGGLARRGALRRQRRVRNTSAWICDWP